jgi:hypothetical protein
MVFQPRLFQKGFNLDTQHRDELCSGGPDHLIIDVIKIAMGKPVPKPNDLLDISDPVRRCAVTGA